MANKKLKVLTTTDGKDLFKVDLTRIDTNATNIGKLTAVIGEDAQHAARVNGANVFTEGQTIQGKVSAKTESAFLSLKLTNYTQNDGTVGESGITESKTLVNTSDKAGVQVSALETKATAESVTTQISVSNSDASAKGALSVEFTRSNGQFVAKAPSALTHNGAQEIATVDFVNQKINDNAVPNASTETAGKVQLASNEDTATGTDNQKAVTPAGLAHTLNPLKEKLDNLQSGNINFAYEDYSDPEHQGEMLEGVVYFLACNKLNEVLILDKKTNKPVNPQPKPEVVDLEIAYYKKLIKDADGRVTDLGKSYTAANLQGVAYTDKAANFTAALTTTVGAADMNNNNNEVPNAKQVRDFVNTKVAAMQLQVVTAEPEQGSMVKGVLYAVVGE